jgi:hypothetical protein
MVSRRADSVQELDAIRRWISSIDTNSADLSKIERDVYAAIVKASLPELPYVPPIAPLAEPGNLDELVGEHLSTVDEHTVRVAERVDTLHDWLIDINNTLSAEIEAVEGQVLKATDAINGLTFQAADEAHDFYWVVDTFNSSTFVDQSKSQAFVNSDHGFVSLPPKNYAPVGTYVVELDTKVMKDSRTFPGCNILVLDQSGGTTDSEPSVQFETRNTKDVQNMFDGDPLTWFEVERNFIPRSQKMSQEGKAWVYDSGGIVGDVLDKTSDFDWKVYVQWPAEAVDQGPDKKGYRIAEMTEIDPTKLQKSAPLSNPGASFDAKLSFTITLNEPTELSNIRLTPLVRSGGANITVDELSAQTDSLSAPIVVAKDVQLTNTRQPSNKIQQELERRTGVSTVGTVFSIPTDRKVTKLYVKLSGQPQAVSLAHPFIWVNVHRRSVRHYGLFDSVDHEDIKKRLSVFGANPPILTSHYLKSGLTGSTLTVTPKNVPSNGQVLDSENKGGILQGLSGVGQDALKSAAARANPFTAALLAIGSDLLPNILNIGGFDRTFTVTDVKTGYDVFTGYRSAIALKEVAVERIQYSDTGVLYTVERSFPRPVTQIGLFADTWIPGTWGAGNWVEFSISLDGGSTWQTITPLSGEAVDQGIKLKASVQKFILQIKLRGNPADVYHSPEVRHYALRGYPA